MKPSPGTEREQTQNMRIFVTGTAGFIGFHLAGTLLEDGHAVIGYDNFNDYYSVKLKRARNAELEKHDAFRCVEGDLCDCPKLQRCFAEEQFDVVCHLAAQAGVRYSLTDRKSTRLNSSHVAISYAVFCLKKKK